MTVQRSIALRLVQMNIHLMVAASPSSGPGEQRLPAASVLFGMNIVSYWRAEGQAQIVTAFAPKLATVDDLFAIPEDERRHELIDGVIEPKGAASGRHGATQRKLSGHVGPFGDDDAETAEDG